METNLPTRYLLANWKMYLNDAESRTLAEAYRESFADLPPGLKIAVFPSALSFTAVAKIFSGTQLTVGAQNIYWVDRGGYTGEISAEMYRSAGAEYALVGHSERRYVHGENNHHVRQKIEAILAAGLTPVVCVGETVEERERGEALEVVEAQLRAAYTDLVWPTDLPLIVAYEPVWAIGTDTPCDAPEAERVHAMIHGFINALQPDQSVAVLYGGSVRPDTVQSYFCEKHIAGVLVGGASVKKETWVAIVDQVRHFV